MKRARLRNSYLKKRTEATKAAYNYQRKVCVSLLIKLKKSYMENYNVKLARDNKRISKNVAPIFSNKIRSKERRALIENKNNFSLKSLTFIQSYLSNRIQGVKINSSFSDYSNADSGLPQE